ncbi:unnamed protein product [Amoebophrya sp. A120]|nr:unnamed protein product [Amoebophrya sp. A120]|eukprot:GSA120T00004258001.1
MRPLLGEPPLVPGQANASARDGTSAQHRTGRVPLRGEDAASAPDPGHAIPANEVQSYARPTPANEDVAKIQRLGYLRAGLSSLTCSFRVGITNKEALDFYANSRYFTNDTNFLLIRLAIFGVYNVVILYSLAFDLIQDESHDHGWFTYLKHWVFLLTSFYLMLACYVRK